jgi:hypothetical protein
MTTKAPTEIPRVLIVVVLGLIVIIVVFAVFPFLSQIFSPAAKASVSNPHETTSGCTGNGPQYYTYTWTFTLTNTGNTDETVTVAIVPTSAAYSGTSPLTTQQYSVPKAMSKLETLTYSPISEGCYTNLTSVIGLQVFQTNPP